MLLQQPGEVVTREELIRRLWGEDTFVDFENSLNTAVARLRAALNDSAEHPRFIETLPKHGYRFIADLYEPPQMAEPPLARKARLVVLPFANLSGDPAQEYFSDAMTEEIIAGLAGLAPGQLGVIVRTTAMHYKASDKDVARIGRELGVDYIVEGSVRRAQDRIAINVQLIQVSDQTHLWTKRYDAELHDLFSIETAAAHAIAEHIDLLPIAHKVRTVRKPTEDLAAYNEYIQGRYHMAKGTSEALAKARQHFEEAIARDSEFALAHDSLAEVYWYLGAFGFVRPREAFSAGILHARRAIEIDDTLAEAHALLGQYHKYVNYNWPEVQREMDRAQELNPTSPLVRTRYAVNALLPHGRIDEAVAEIERALEWDPLSQLTHFWFAVMFLLGHQWDRVIDQGRLLIKLDPKSFFGHYISAGGCRGKRMFDEAIAAQQRAVELSGDAPAMLGWLGLTLALSGKAAEARALRERLHALASKGHVPPTSIAWIHIGLKETDAAFEWLDRAIDAHDQIIMPIKSYDFFEPIRADPRYLGLLRRMNLEP